MIDEVKIMDRAIMFLMIISIVILIASFKWLPTWCIIIAYLFAIAAIKIDMLECHPFVVMRRDFSNKNNDTWEEKLTYFPNIELLKKLYYFKIHSKRNFNVIYHFVEFNSLSRDKKEKILNKYYNSIKET